MKSVYQVSVPVNSYDVRVDSYDTASGRGRAVPGAATQGSVHSTQPHTAPPVFAVLTAAHNTAYRLPLTAYSRWPGSALRLFSIAYYYLY
ncbi:hypothetical protein E2C01_094264 [Portunus trituberculatus]|uniref:Uncharacterized protein n=1 Tax=Portunus trituberculatus TaxID=210409 RepID=A0A5B7K164_PORTR|nr:hypothetical protein [Portunus trituberculatus]